jgi:transketolase
LIATGPEVAIALAARDPLQAAGVPTAVVSMPCGELFGRQDANYRASVIDRATVRVAVEAAVRHGWDRWIGEDGGFVGMSRFGAPGPETELFAHFGITAERVAAEVQAWLQGLIPYMVARRRHGRRGPVGVDLRHNGPSVVRHGGRRAATCALG